jgi:Leucine-rich repeat (LRR) protein
LSLSENLLTTIPAAVPTFPNLTSLDLRKNKISKIHSLYTLLCCPSLVYVRIDGNPIHEKKEVKDRLLSAQDVALLDMIRAMEDKKDLRPANSLLLMVLGEGESGQLNSILGVKRN